LGRKKKKKKKKKEVIMVELQNFESLGGCIAKIETLKVELKIAPNFEGVKYNFSQKKKKKKTIKALTTSFCNHFGPQLVWLCSYQKLEKNYDQARITLPNW
jgi:hypothetical protein